MSGGLTIFRAVDSNGYEYPAASFFDAAQRWFGYGVGVIFLLFNLWMLIDAIRKREWPWVAYMIILPGLSAVWYFFHLYRGPTSRGFELPGSFDRKRIRDLQAQIHNLDHAHHHSQLGDVYFQQGKYDKAEASYRAALQRDGNDPDTRAHFGQCLLRLKRPAEARPLLEGVLRDNPKHDFNYTAMAYAEMLTALGETDNAIKSWEYVIGHNSYPRAKTQLAELYFAKNQPDLARPLLQDVIADDAHAPAYQRRRDRVWISRAKSLLRKLR